MASPTNNSTGAPKGSADSEATVASFSATQASRSTQRRTVVVGQKSPLLIATPPEITRALAFSHPFLLPLNQVLGLVTWSSGDPWESFLLLVGFWVLVLYGDVAIQWAGPVLLVAGLIAGMYSRRYSPLSTQRTGEQATTEAGEKSQVKHQKSLDEIVDVLNQYTARCEVLMDPLLHLTEFLSTQRTATSATTRPALTSLFLRILMVLPIWLALTLSPLHLLTTRHVILVLGTLCLSWHSRPAQVSRTLLWRSLTVRYLVSLVSGLTFADSASHTSRPPLLPPRSKDHQDNVANSLASSSSSGRAGVRFTFAVYENQRRWLGLGWTSSLFAYERAAWTDEHLNPTRSKDDFKLPTVEGAGAAWQWVSGSIWHVETSSSKSSTSSGLNGSNEGWIYYDNKWSDGRRTDGWGRYTRRRKWYRDAELVDRAANTSSNATELEAAEPIPSTATAIAKEGHPHSSVVGSTIAAGALAAGATAAAPSASATLPDSIGSPTKRKSFMSRRSQGHSRSNVRTEQTPGPVAGEEEGHEAQGLDIGHVETEGLWKVGDEMKMGLG